MVQQDGKSTSVVTLSENYPKERARNYGTLEPDGEITDKDNPFLDPDVADYWRNVYEKAQYECRDVFDPTLTWSEEEERQLVRKLDWRICLWAVCHPFPRLLIHPSPSSLITCFPVCHVLRTPSRSREPCPGSFRHLPGRSKAQHKW